MIPYGRQDVNKNDIDAVVDVLKSDYLTQGPIVLNFEIFPVPAYQVYSRP